MSDDRRNNFDAIRFLAALQVIVVHSAHHFNFELPGALRWIAAFPGVPIFFFSRGFLIAGSWERFPKLLPYFKNRALRIFPALWLCFAVSVASVFVSRGYLGHDHVKELAVWVSAQLSFFQFYNPSFLRDYGVGTLNGSLWTIPVELQFYTLTPLLYFALARSKISKPNRPMILLILLGMVAFFWVNAGRSNSTGLYYKLIYVSFVPHIYLFLLGVLSFQNWNRIRHYFENRALVWLVGYIFSQFLAELLGLRHFGNQMFPGIALMLCGLILASAFSYRSFSTRVLRGNDISYGLYLYHMVFINALLNAGVTNSWRGLSLTLALSGSFAFLSWRFLEKPILRFKARPTRHQRA